MGSLIFTIWFLLGRLRNLNKIQKDTTFYIIVLYSVFKLSSALYTINPADAILNSIFWFNVSLLYLTISNLNINKYSETLIKVIVLAGVINALVGNIQALAFIFFGVKILNIYGWLWPYGFRVTGLSFDANHLAAFLVLPIFLSIQKIIGAEKTYSKYL